jgi:hypothetical protein
MTEAGDDHADLGAASRKAPDFTWKSPWVKAILLAVRRI